MLLITIFFLLTLEQCFGTQRTDDVLLTVGLVSENFVILFHTYTNSYLILIKLFHIHILYRLFYILIVNKFSLSFQKLYSDICILPLLLLTLVCFYLIAFNFISLSK